MISCKYWVEKKEFRPKKENIIVTNSGLRLNEEVDNSLVLFFRTNINAVKYCKLA